jgi:hypothetical protein
MIDRLDIIDMARKALSHNVEYTVWTLSTPHIIRFAELVAANEREACASIADKYADNVGDADIGASIAVDIRARGQDA